MRSSTDWRAAGLQVLIALLLLAGWPAAHALAIHLTFAAPGQRSVLSNNGRFAFPAAVTGGGDVAAVFTAAARTWESLLHDDRSFNITVGWVSTFSNGVLAAAAPGSDRFNEIALSTRLSHYADPTPDESSEFSGYAEFSADLGGGPINTGRGFAGGPGVNGFDLLTTALHEIGHILGNPFDQPPLGSLAALPVNGGPFAGTALPCFVQSGICGHLNLRAALMNPGGAFGTYTRALISGADLLFVATDGGFGSIDNAAVGPRAAVPEPPAVALALLALLSAAIAPAAVTRRRRRLH